MKRDVNKLFGITTLIIVIAAIGCGNENVAALDFSGKLEETKREFETKAKEALDSQQQHEAEIAELGKQHNAEAEAPRKEESLKDYQRRLEQETLDHQAKAEQERRDIEINAELEKQKDVAHHNAEMAKIQKDAAAKMAKSLEAIKDDVGQSTAKQKATITDLKKGFQDDLALAEERHRKFCDQHGEPFCSASKKAHEKNVVSLKKQIADLEEVEAKL